MSLYIYAVGHYTITLFYQINESNKIYLFLLLAMPKELSPVSIKNDKLKIHQMLVVWFILRLQPSAFMHGYTNTIKPQITQQRTSSLLQTQKKHSSVITASLTGKQHLFRMQRRRKTEMKTDPSKPRRDTKTTLIKTNRDAEKLQKLKTLVATVKLYRAKPLQVTLPPQQHLSPRRHSGFEEKLVLHAICDLCL